MSNEDTLTFTHEGIHYRIDISIMMGWLKVNVEGCGRPKQFSLKLKDDDEELK